MFSTLRLIYSAVHISKIMAFKVNFWGLECSVTHRVIRTQFFLAKTIVSKEIFVRIQQKTTRCGRDEKVNAFTAKECGSLNVTSANFTKLEAGVCVCSHCVSRLFSNTVAF